MSEELSNELLSLFKALADKNRLRIIVLLSQKTYAVEELSAALGVGPSTVSHHLSVLGKAGLVEGKVDGYYSVYRLISSPLEEMAKKLLQPGKLQGLAEQPSKEPNDDLDRYDRKVLAAFMTPEGRVKAIPAQEKKFIVLVKHLLNAFEPGKKYSEKEVNTILKDFTADTALFRRYFIEYKFMEREGGGGKYWRI